MATTNVTLDSLESFITSADTVLIDFWATWGGCGNHIEQALAGVPQRDRCQGPRGSRKERPRCVPVRPLGQSAS